MLAWAAWVLTAAALGGLGLVALSQSAGPVARWRWPGWVHGAVGVAGFGLLVAGLGAPPRGVAQGAGAFGLVAAGFVGGAVLLGLGVVAARPCAAGHRLW